MKSRIAKVRKIMRKKDLDAMLITDMNNIRYLSNFTGSNAQIFLTLKDNFFFTDGRYEIQSKKEVKDFKINVYYNKGFLEEISKYIKIKSIKKIGFEDHDVTYQYYLKLRKNFKKKELCPVSEYNAFIRMVKDKEELKLIRKAIKISEEAILEVKKKIKLGVKESYLAEEFERIAKSKGAQGLSFDPLFVSGPNSAIVHGKPGNRKIKKGDFILMDFGCVYKGYRSDQTLTYGVGKLSNKSIKIYNLVKEAQELAIKSIKPGVRLSKPAKLVENYFKSNGYELVHGLGHGIGLEIHEQPNLSSIAKSKIEEGMVFSVEPGIYVEGLGGVRIEDLVIVTKQGCKKLTTISKELEIL